MQAFLITMVIMFAIGIIKYYLTRNIRINQCKHILEELVLTFNDLTQFFEQKDLENVEIAKQLHLPTDLNMEDAHFLFGINRKNEFKFHNLPEFRRGFLEIANSLSDEVDSIENTYNVIVVRDFKEILYSLLRQTRAIMLAHGEKIT